MGLLSITMTLRMYFCLVVDQQPGSSPSCNPSQPITTGVQKILQFSKLAKALTCLYSLNLVLYSTASSSCNLQWQELYDLAEPHCVGAAGPS